MKIKGNRERERERNRQREQQRLRGYKTQKKMTKNRNKYFDKIFKSLKNL